MFVSSVMQTICWSSGGATSSRGNWDSALWIAAASRAHSFDWADAGGPAAIRLMQSSAARAAARSPPHREAAPPSARPPAALAFNLARGVHHPVAGPKRRGVARYVGAHRFEHCDVGPLAVLGRQAVLLQHPAHGLAQFADFAGLGADHMTRHDRG